MAVVEVEEFLVMVVTRYVCAVAVTMAVAEVHVLLVVVAMCVMSALKILQTSFYYA